MIRSERVLGGLIVAVFLALAAMWLWQLTRPRRSVEALPDAERAALYQRTLETLRTSCSADHGVDLSEYCQQQAEFIVEFDACDADCRALARRFSKPASR